jgi:hypothetical protein
LWATVRGDADGIAFEVYAYRELTQAEIGAEIALFRSSHGKLTPSKTHKIFSPLGMLLD